VNQHATKDDYGLIYNLYMVSVGFRKAILLGGFDQAKFAKDFGLISVTGPYFDIVGRDFTYVVHPKYMKSLQPLFAELKNTYSDNEKVMERRRIERAKIIGEILGYPCLGDVKRNKRAYGIVLDIHSENDDTKQRGLLYHILCHENNLSEAMLFDELKRSEKFLKPLKLKMSFSVSRYW